MRILRGSYSPLDILTRYAVIPIILNEVIEAKIILTRFSNNYWKAEYIRYRHHKTGCDIRRREVFYKEKEDEAFQLAKSCIKDNLEEAEIILES